MINSFFSLIIVSWILLLSFAGAKCPQGTYLEASKCLNCPDSCLQCISKTKCVQCKPQRALYQGECIKTCPPTTFPGFNDSMAHLFCQEPFKVLNGTKSEIILASREIVDYSQSNAQFAYISKCNRKEISSIAISGWIRPKSELLKSTFLEVYINPTALVFQVSFIKGQIVVEEHLSVASANIQWENGKWKRFIFKMKGNNLDNWKSLYVFFGGGPNRKFEGSLKALTIISLNYQSKYQPYGGLEKLIYAIPFISDRPETIESVSVNSIKAYQLDFEIESHVVLKFSAIFNEQNISFLYNGCRMFELKNDQGKALLLLRIDYRSSSVAICSTECHEIKVRNLDQMEFIFELIYHQDLQKLLIYVNNIELSIENFRGTKASWTFGGGGDNSCSYRPFNILVYEGESGLSNVLDVNCVKRETIQNTCSECREGYYYNPTTGQCTDSRCEGRICPLSLKQQLTPFCDISNFGRCEACKPGYHLNRHDYCVLDCPENQCSFPISDSNFECRDCPISHCKEAHIENSQILCLECHEGFKLSNNTCVQNCQNLIHFNGKCCSSCPEEHFFSSELNTCIKCSDNCKSCQSEQVCDSCQEGYIIVNKSCVSIGCVNKKLNSESIECPPCEINCLECQIGHQRMECLLCKDNLFLFNGTCLATCPPGYYPQTHSKECLPFSMRLILKNGTSENLTLVEKRPIYLDFTEETIANYKECPENCMACVKQESGEIECRKCKTGWFQLDGACVRNCGSFHTESLENCKLRDVCERMPACSDCLVPSTYFSVWQPKSHCQLCQTIIPFSLRYQLERYIEPYTSRKLQEVLIVKENNCTPCDERCKTCGSDFKCAECNDGYFLNFNGACQRTCPMGFYPDSNLRRCLVCPSSCLACWSHDLCWKCQKGYSVSNFTCSPNSGSGVEGHSFIKALASDLWPFRSTKNLNDISKKWRFSWVAEPISEMLQCIAWEFDPTMYSKLIYNRKYKHYLDLCLIDQQIFANYIREGPCDKSCLICTHGADTANLTCLQCSPLIPEGEIIGDRCACPSSRPFLNRVTRECVQQCPDSMLLINYTSECVPSCSLASIFSDEQPLFSIHKTCSRTCPETHRAQLDPDNPDHITCVEKRSHQAYLAHASIIRNRKFPLHDGCAKLADNCYRPQQVNLSPSELTMISKYIDIVSEDENILDIVSQPAAILSFALYSIQPKVHTDPSHNHEFLSFLSLVGYGCLTQYDPYLIILSLDTTLSYTHITLETIELVAQVFEALTQCFEKVREQKLNAVDNSYRGKMVDCDLIGLNSTEESKLFNLDDSFSALLVTKVSPHPQDLYILYCKLRTLNNQSLERNYFLGVVESKPREHWLEVNMTIDLKMDETKGAVYVWEDGKWNNTKSKSLTRMFSTVSYNKSISLVVSPTASLFFDFQPQIKDKKSPVLVYLGLGVMVILLVASAIFTIKKFSSEINKKLPRNALEEESEIELHKR